MSEIFKSIVTGLQEAIDDNVSEKKSLRRRHVTILPVKEYTPQEVQKIRNQTGLSQKLFAGYMGVSVKTVEAWESGTNRPSGAASRILSMMEMEENLINLFPFVQVK